MQLNEIHNPHEHASVSLKVILLIFAVILVGVLGYLVWNFLNTPDTTNTSSESNNTVSQLKATVDATDWREYLNTTYGFSVSYPKEWKAGEEASPEPRDQEPWMSYLFSTTFAPDGSGAYNNLIAVSDSNQTELMAAIESSVGKLTWTDVTINGLKAKKAIEADGTNDYIVSSTKYTFHLSYVPDGTSNGTEISKTVISTFEISK